MAGLIVLGAAVLIGLVLVARLAQARPGWSVWPGALHGGVAASGFLLALAGLATGPARGVHQGAGSFGAIAAVLLAAALLVAGTIVLAQLRRRAPPTLAIVLHATLGVGGIVILAAYVSLSP